MTNMSGIYSSVIATQIFVFITSFDHDFPKLIRSQTQCLWNGNVETINVDGKTFCIIRLESIGREVARGFKAH